MNGIGRSLLSGAAGAGTLTLLHELTRRLLPEAPRMDILGMRAIARLLRAVGLRPPEREELYNTAFAGDLLTNTLYYSLVGLDAPGNRWLRGTVLGLTAGLGAVMLPGPLNLGRTPSSRTRATSAMTVGLYLAGGLAAAVAEALAEGRERAADDTSATAAGRTLNGSAQQAELPTRGASQATLAPTHLAQRRSPPGEAALAPTAVTPTEATSEPAPTYQAQREAATETDAVPAPAQPEQPDDLQIIEGIGPKVSTVITAAGIHSFADLAATNSERLRQILREAGIGVLNPETWPEQARLAAEGNWDALADLQQRIKNGRVADRPGD
jgi:predicted flap endonuclease-1-like 5' DNA nuclease